MAVSKRSGSKQDITSFRKKRVSRRKKIADQADYHTKKHIKTRVNNLKNAKRAVLVWLGMLVFLLAGLSVQALDLRNYYTSKQPSQGGTFVEGYVGSVSNLNPLFARSPAEVAASELMFAKLYERNADSQLVSKLAANFTASSDGKQLIVKLRDDITWSDGEAIDSEDVTFTLRHAQHPDAQSKYKSRWSGVKVTAIDALTVKMDIETPNPTFSEVLELPLIPEHILTGISSADIRTSDFNQQPEVVSGAFRLRETDVNGKRHRLLLEPSEVEWQTKPLLSFYIIDSFTQEETMAVALADRRLSAIAPGFSQDYSEFDIDPEDFEVYQYLSTSVAFSFFNNTDPTLSSPLLRQSLTRYLDRGLVNEASGWAYRAESPLSNFYDQDGLPKQLDTDRSLAANTLNDSDDFRLQDGRWSKKVDNDDEDAEDQFDPISLKITVGDLPELRKAAEQIAAQWTEFGVPTEVEAIDTVTLVQNRLPSRTYQVLIHPIDLGVNSDIYSYWHSSQSRLQGFNFSSYSNETADINLSDAATITQDELARVKLKKFLEVWRDDAPAIALGGVHIERYAQKGIELREDVLLDQPQDILRYAPSIALKTGRELSIEE